jgi:LysR family transcriptional regulator, regulator for bpeEF and oprC
MGEPVHGQGADVFVALGWPAATELVQRRIGHARLFVCAAPAYWAAHGMPRRPKDLERHNCLLIRTVEGTVMDLWSFRHGEEEESVTVSGWLVASNNNRDLVIEAALAGEGVARTIDLANRAHVQSGRLVPALVGWESTFVPPVTLMYRPSGRRVPRVRVFVDFMTGVFRELERQRGQPVVSSGRPAWAGPRYGGASRFGPASGVVARRRVR